MKAVLVLALLFMCLVVGRGNRCAGPPPTPQSVCVTSGLWRIYGNTNKTVELKDSAISNNTLEIYSWSLRDSSTLSTTEDLNIYTAPKEKDSLSIYNGFDEKFPHPILKVGGKIRWNLAHNETPIVSLHTHPHHKYHYIILACAHEIEGHFHLQINGKSRSYYSSHHHYGRYCVKDTSEALIYVIIPKNSSHAVLTGFMITLTVILSLALIVIFAWIVLHHYRRFSYERIRDDPVSYQYTYARDREGTTN